MGENCINDQYKLLAPLGKKALIVTGTKSAKANGSYEDVLKALAANGQDYVLYDKVMANPTDVCVFETGTLGKKENCDFVIAIGGGSPMDAAKAAAVIAAEKNVIPKEDLFNVSFTNALPIIVIPTTAGTGSETTQYSVLVDTTEEDGFSPKIGGPMKRSVSSPLLFPQLAFLDAKYMIDLNREITVNTVIDALSHAVEGMLSQKTHYMSDVLAVESISMIMDTMDDLLNFPADAGSFPFKKREQLLLASALAGMVIAQTGTVLPHSMGYLFTINWGTDHGRANGLLMESFLSWCREKEQTVTITPRIPKLCSALGMELEKFFAILERLLVKREKATEPELALWSTLPMKNAANTYIQPNQEEITRIYYESVGR